jgi:hypothetical protein
MFIYTYRTEFPISQYAGSENLNLCHIIFINSYKNKCWSVEMNDVKIIGFVLLFILYVTDNLFGLLIDLMNQINIRM